MSTAAFLAAWFYMVGMIAVMSMVADYLVPRKRKPGWREILVVLCWPVSMMIAACYVVLRSDE